MHPPETPPPHDADERHTIEAAWRGHRGRLIDIGYRMLGSLADAEDVAADAYAKLLTQDVRSIGSIEGWLTTVTARMCIDRLRSAEQSRRAYVGPWLPEPIVSTPDPAGIDPADRVTLDDSVRMALLVVLDRLSPAERTAFVLHDVFGQSFGEVASIVGRSPAACRQLASRARRKIEADPEAGTPIPRHEIDAVARRFAAACTGGQIDPLLHVLDPDVVGDFDSGGHVPGAPIRTLVGAGPVARVLLRVFTNAPLVLKIEDVNGEPGVVGYSDGHIAVVMALGVSGGRVDVLHSIGNPAKLP